MDSAQGEGVTSKSRKYEQVQIWQCCPYMENQMLALSLKSPQLQRRKLSERSTEKGIAILLLKFWPRGHIVIFFFLLQLSKFVISPGSLCSRIIRIFRLNWTKKRSRRCFPVNDPAIRENSYTLIEVSGCRWRVEGEWALSSPSSPPFCHWSEL